MRKGFAFGPGNAPAEGAMGRRYIDYLAADANSFYTEVISEMENLISECKEALGEMGETWDGNPRREIRDCSDR
jgi:predicted hydrocarbon binding protein